MRTMMLFLFVVLCGFIMILNASAWAGMIVTLKNGKTIRVDADKNDIVSITFEDMPPRVGNWNFESGNLAGWHAAGVAFANQPTYGDNPTARHRGQPSNHQGNYWIGGYENRPGPNARAGAIQGDGPKGTLTSDPFTIDKGTIRFLIGGGCDMNSVRAELIVDGNMVRQSTGKCTETMSRDSWDVSAFVGRRAQIRLVDDSGGGWGHINFDDVQFDN